jgi:hypothetical protein
MPNPTFMIVEDGSAKIDANAYWDVDAVTEYLVNKGITDWTNYTQNEQARAIISASFYIEKRFRRRYRGLRETVEQAFGWPRIGSGPRQSMRSARRASVCWRRTRSAPSRSKTSRFRAPALCPPPRRSRLPASRATATLS